MPKQSQNCSAKQSQLPLTRGENILPINLMPKQSPIYYMYDLQLNLVSIMSVNDC